MAVAPRDVSPVASSLLATRGFIVRVQKPVTRAMFMAACDALAQGHQYRVEPEPDGEGGVRVYDGFSGDSESGPRKSMTLRPHLPHIGGLSTWPQVDRAQLDAWRASDEVLFSKGVYLPTTLVAARGAPAWTISELLRYKQVFARLWGARVVKLPRCDADLR